MRNIKVKNVKSGKETNKNNWCMSCSDHHHHHHSAYFIRTERFKRKTKARTENNKNKCKYICSPTGEFNLGNVSENNTAKDKIKIIFSREINHSHNLILVLNFYIFINSANCSDCPFKNTQLKGLLDETGG